jgi:hypothetical protein
LGIVQEFYLPAQLAAFKEGLGSMVLTILLVSYLVNYCNSNQAKILYRQRPGTTTEIIPFLSKLVMKMEAITARTFRQNGVCVKQRLASFSVIE